MLTVVERPRTHTARRRTANFQYQPPSLRGAPSWWEEAACRAADPELFFAQEGASREETRVAEYEAKLVCWRCPVQRQCLQAAVENDERYGVWGGLSPRERKRRFARS